MKSFELTTSHSISILVFLLIFILFFQPYIFGFMMHTILGRLTLLLILILISSYKIIFGLIGVSLIIYLYERYHKYEGFETLTSTSDDSTSSKNVSEQIPPSTKVMSQTKKTELENSMIPKDSSQLPSPKTQSTEKVEASESSSKPTSNNEGFANMFKLEPATF